MELPDQSVSLRTIAREWARIGITGFGGPPAHIALLRRLCVQDKQWISEREFEDGIAATNLLPGPASTQLAIFCGWRLRGTFGALIAGFCFIVPGLVIILCLAALFLASNPPIWVSGMAAGAGAVVPVVALHASGSLAPGSWKRAGDVTGNRIRWLLYLSAGVVAAITVGPYLVLVLVAAGLIELLARRARPPSSAGRIGAIAFLSAAPVAIAGGLGALAWVALKVGALSYGGGFIIIPLMQHDAVNTYHWMTGAQFLNAVALGQVTPGPVVQTVAVVGYAVGGVGGGLFAAAIAFAPSFIFVLVGGPHFDQIRKSPLIQSFLTGAGAAAIGGIGGSAVTLGLDLHQWWQAGVLALAAAWVWVARRGIVPAFLFAGAIGAVAALAGAPVPH